MSKEFFGLTYRSWMLMGLAIYAMIVFVDLIASWLAPKILRWFRRRKEVPSDD